MRNRNRVNRAVRVMLGVMTACCASIASGPSLRLALEVTTDTFVEGEPVEARLVIANEGSEPAEVLLQYPSLRALGTGGLRLRIPEASENPKLAESFGRWTQIMPLAAGGQWAGKVYLQRYMAAPPAGRHAIPYSLEIAFRAAGAPGSETSVAHQDGVLAFAVAPASPEKLAAAIERYVTGFESTGYWQQRFAVEALSLIRDPAVVPHLAELLRAGWTGPAFEALASFAENAEAREIVLAAANSKRPVEAIPALEVLGRWRYSMDLHDLQVLLADEVPAVRRAALHYIQSAGRRDCLGLVAPLTQDADPAVSDEARRTRTFLEK